VLATIQFVTTWNPNTDGIPAEPLEISLLGIHDFLSALSKITIQEEQQTT